jgi:hypothetical protein
VRQESRSVPRSFRLGGILSGLMLFRSLFTSSEIEMYFFGTKSHVYYWLWRFPSGH